VPAGAAMGAVIPSPGSFQVIFDGDNAPENFVTFDGVQIGLDWSEIVDFATAPGWK